jgi:hypothetical protein
LQALALRGSSPDLSLFLCFSFDDFAVGPKDRYFSVPTKETKRKSNQHKSKMEQKME